jgi:predicted RNA-binding Zn-ribbon protein involved in translation (DUF1610 family)
MNIQYDRSPLGCFLTFIAATILLTSVGLGWLVNGFLIFLAVLFMLPVALYFGFSWWMTRKLAFDKCPSCGEEITGFKDRVFNCPHCGETIEVVSGKFKRATPEGTIDVSAIDVSVQQLED